MRRDSNAQSNWLKPICWPLVAKPDVSRPAAVGREVSGNGNDVAVLRNVHLDEGHTPARRAIPHNYGGLALALACVRAHNVVSVDFLTEVSG